MIDLSVMRLFIAKAHHDAVTDACLRAWCSQEILYDLVVNSLTYICIIYYYFMDCCGKVEYVINVCRFQRLNVLSCAILCIVLSNWVVGRTPFGLW